MQNKNKHEELIADYLHICMWCQLIYKNVEMSKIIITNININTSIKKYQYIKV